LFHDSGLEVRNYRYFDKSTVGLDFDGLKADLLVRRPIKLPGILYSRFR
jgi:aspartate/tyrosine/aromatic aminotransferase